MATSMCSNCKLRAMYDKNHNSFAGRFWRWHINFCPGWRKYFDSLSAEEKVKVAEKYNFWKYHQ
ncbi:MAG: hypothetical protein JXC33_08810 [Deltaproteobacteria bacterium]|nr:hypothetical protein [Deltaproteobacteria bacterium]MBN2686780.1 hypothetical protein [Deltaproteobacteria bacterium]